MPLIRHRARHFARHTAAPFAILTLLALAAPLAPALARDMDDDAAATATGFAITPLAARGAALAYFGKLDPANPASPGVTNPSAMVASPDGTLLAVLTSGFNGMSKPDGSTDRAHSTERLMIFRPNKHGSATKIAEAALPASFAGLAWSPDGKRLAATLGVGDAVAIYTWDGKALVAAGDPIPLGHAAGRSPARRQFL
jgi:hypothetical protein